MILLGHISRRLIEFLFEIGRHLLQFSKRLRGPNRRQTLRRRLGFNSVSGRRTWKLMWLIWQDMTRSLESPHWRTVMRSLMWLPEQFTFGHGTSRCIVQSLRYPPSVRRRLVDGWVARRLWIRFQSRSRHRGRRSRRVRGNRKSLWLP